MHTDFSSNRGRGLSAARLFLRWSLSLLSAWVFIQALGPGVHLTSADSNAAHSRVEQQSNAGNAAAKYDCVGDIPFSPIEGEQNVEQAIDDALDLLNGCEPCRRMFSSDPTYAARLLNRLRRDGVIVISESVPTRSRLSRDGKRLEVHASEKLDEAAAVIDMARPKSKAMAKPCIYINRKGFIVTGERAENYALYPLPRPVQRAVAILHELAHVAGVLAQDGGKTEESRKRSVANTDCVRYNCVSCKYYSCPTVPKRPRTRPRNKA